MSDLEFKYLNKAQALGVDTDNPTAMHYLVKGIRYSEARFSMDKANRSVLAEKLGTTVEGIDLHQKNPLLKQAMQIVFEVLMEEMRDSDLKQAVLRSYSENYMSWFVNMSRIAKGERHPTSGKEVLDRDAVNAFTALQNTKINEAFQAMLFLPDTTNSPEKNYLAAMGEAGEGDDVVDLDARPSKQLSPPPLPPPVEPKDPA